MRTFDEALARLSPAEITRRKLANAGRKGAASRVFGKLYELAGGPLDGKRLRLTSPSTGVLTLHGETGRYTAVHEITDPMRREVCRGLDMHWRNAHRVRWHEEARLLHWEVL